jgi:transcriptional regulator with XRE-family HTH domain
MKDIVETSRAQITDSVSWREAYPEYSEGQLIGKALAGARYREGLTQIQLSELAGISQRHISEMENGKRPSGKTLLKSEPRSIQKSSKIEEKIIGKAYEQLKSSHKDYAINDLPVLFIGESGSGKELFAQLFMELNPRTHCLPN